MAVPPVSSPRFSIRLSSLRQQLWLAFGVLSLLVVLMAIAAPLALNRNRAAASQAVTVDGHMSRLASDVALKAQVARRYDQSYFLYVSVPSQQEHYAVAWEQAVDELAAAVAAFERDADAEADRRQARLWQVALALYEQGVREVMAAVEAGRISTPGEANRLFSSYRQNIQTLGDLSVDFATRKALAAERTAAELERTGTMLNIGIGLLGALAVLLALAWSFFIPRTLIRPLSRLSAVSADLASGNLQARAELDRRDEIGELGRNFDRMAATIQQRTADLEAQNAAAQLARREAESARAQVQEQLATIESQHDVIMEMSVPILPLLDDVLVMPLVGALDSGRMAQAQERALQAIETEQSRFLLIDITGVPVVDTQVARGLVEIVQTTRLLGAEALLVGIRPEVAQAIVGLGIDLQEIPTRSSLQSGISYTTSRITRHHRKGNRP